MKLHVLNFDRQYSFKCQLVWFTVCWIVFQSSVKDTTVSLLEVKLQKAKETIEHLRSELQEAKSVPLKENRMDKKRYSKWEDCFCSDTFCLVSLLTVNTQMLQGLLSLTMCQGCGLKKITSTYMYM